MYRSNVYGCGYRGRKCGKSNSKFRTYRLREIQHDTKRIIRLQAVLYSWGNETACYPANTDVTDYFYCVSRMFSWVANSVILSMWSKVDKKLNKRLIESVTQSINIWLNGLMAEEKILGGRVEFLEEENTTADLLAGKAKFHIYLTPPSPAKELVLC